MQQKLEKRETPLSPSQKRAWSFHESAASLRAWCAVRILGPLDWRLFERSFRFVVERRDVFRMIPWRMPDQEPCELGYRDLTRLPRADRDAALADILDSARSERFELDEGPLAKAVLVRASDSRSVLSLAVSAMVGDPVTLQNLVRELSRVYAALAQGAEPRLEEPVQYAAVSEWQNEWLASEETEYGRAYWLKQTVDPESLQSLDSDGSVFKPDRHTWILHRETLADLESFARERQSNEAAVLLGCWFAFLYRLDPQTKPLVSVLLDGRTDPVFQDQIGPYAHGVPLTGGSTDFELLLEKTGQDLAGAERFQDCFVWRQWAGGEHDSHASQYIAHAFEHFHAMPIIQAGLNWSLDDLDACLEPFRLKLSCSRIGDDLRLALHYDTRRHAMDEVVRLQERFSQFVSDLLKNKSLTRARILGENERKLVLETFNDTAIEHADRFLQQSFEDQAARSPNLTALIFADGELTYGELNQKSNRLAHYLRARGAGPETAIGLFLDRSPDLMVALLAVLKSGSAYLPLDPAYPAQRLASMIEDARPKILLTNAALAGLLPEHEARVIVLDRERTAIDAGSCANPTARASTGQAAYLIYTSGSTGKPKAVIGVHHAIVNRIQWMNRTLPLTVSDRVLQRTSISFDASIWEIFAPLSAGASVILADDETVRDAGLLVRVMGEERVTRAQFPPSLLSAMLDEPEFARIETLRQVFCGGERLSETLRDRFRSAFADRVDLHNLYGPTETSIDASSGPCAPVGPVAIGKPLDNVQIYLVDSFMAPTPLGIKGELLVGGRNVVRGYWNRPALTAARFVPDPFGRQAGARLYRTGDDARYREDGQIEYLGRIDDQVKIRGYRIELGEIEHAIIQTGVAREAVVVPWPDIDGDPRLVGYPILERGAVFEAASLRARLLERLPEYMVPAIFIPIEKAPLTPNGKLDRAALPRPLISRDETYRAPTSETEQKLAVLWGEALGLDRIGVHDNFFELGGQSLLATRLISRFRRAFHANLSVRLFFDHPTIEAMAAEIDQAVVGPKQESMPLEPVLERDPYLPLSLTQGRLWFLDRLDPGAALYNLPVALRLDGPLSVQGLAQCFETLTGRHETLRSRFAERDGAAYVIIDPDWASGAAVIDLCNLPSSEREQYCRQALEREAVRPFSLTDGPLFRVTLFRIDQRRHVLLINMHHIISDGWSIRVMFRELTRCYRASIQARVPRLNPLSVQYADFAHWQRQWLTGAVLDRQLSYWRNRLEDAPALLDLPTDRSRPSSQTHRGGQYAFEISGAAKLIQIGQQVNATPFMTLLSAYAVLLARYANQTDLCIGTPVANRNDLRLEALIGFFVNMVVMRLNPDGESSFAAFLAGVKRIAAEAYDHQDTPFEQIIEKLQPERNPSHSPLFQVVFALDGDDSVSERDAAFPGLRTQIPDFDFPVAKYDLILNVFQGGTGGLACLFNYNSDLFDRQTIVRMAEHFENLLSGLAAYPDRPLNQIEMIGVRERRCLAERWSQTESAYPKTRSLAELFQDSAARRPDSPAITHLGGVLTFDRLNRLANRLAHRLLERGVVGPVAICMAPGPDLCIAILAVVKTGNAYAPIDSDYPAERIRLMLADCGAAALLTHASVSESLGELKPVNLVFLDDPASFQGVPETDPDRDHHPAAPAYIMYTSGSTGRPRGVVVTHANIIRLVFDDAYVQMTAEDGMAQVSNCSFDAFTFELWTAWRYGARLCLVEKQVYLEPLAFKALQEKLAFNVMFITAALFSQYAQTKPDVFQSMKYVLFGGDKADPNAVRAVLEHGPPTHLLNGYGPTETTTFAAWHAVTALDPEANTVPIGRPIANGQLHVMDRGFRLAPLGVRGELCIGGDGLAWGYLNHPGLTAEKFAPDPFSKTAGARLYRSGDLVRHLGRLEDEHPTLACLGRFDHQVKVRGFRIELGEIEHALTSLPTVKEALVTIHVREGEKCLTAYVQIVEGSERNPILLKDALALNLPDYMIPGSIVFLDRFPLTSNGKIDRAALPAPEVVLDKRRDLGLDSFEEVLVGVWQNFLGRIPIAASDNFFDLGGHSLMATRVVSRIRDVFGVAFPLRSFFANPDLAAMAYAVRGRVMEKRGDEAPPITALNREGGSAFPLSFAQERVWFLNRLDPDDPTYNIALALRLNGVLAVHGLAESLNEIQNRHSVLRARFETVEGKPAQHIAASAVLPFKVIDLTRFSGLVQSEMLKSLLLDANRRPHDLGKGNLLRVELYRLDERQHLLSMNIHHIVFDGWSLRVLLSELSELYRVRFEERPPQLADLPIQYADYARWQRQWLQGETLSGHLAFWETQLAGIPRVLELPADFPSPVKRSRHGAHLEIRLEPETATRLRELCRERDVTPSMALMACYALLLARYSGQDDICVGTPIANRNRSEIENLVGFFVNTLVMRHDLAGNPGFGEYLQRVRRMAINAYTHQDLPFEQIVDRLQPERDRSVTPLFQVSFSHWTLDIDGWEFAWPGLRVEQAGDETPIAKFDLTLNTRFDENGALVANFNYDTERFKETTVARMARRFKQLLHNVVARPHLPIDNLSIQESGEYAQLNNWAQTQKTNLKELTLLDHFETRVRETPHSIAVGAFASSNAEKTFWLDFQTLDRKANWLAHALRDLKVNADIPVAIYCDRSLEMVIGLLGVLKAGGAYLPLDPAYPEERLAYMLSDARAPVILAKKDRARLLTGHAAKTLYLDDLGMAQQPPAAAHSCENLAYTIYTSGSTGRPKGVMATHRGLMHYLQWCLDQYQIEGPTPLHTSMSFDATVTSLWAPLLAGSPIWLLPEKNPQDLLADMLGSGTYCSLLKATPAHLDLLDAMTDIGRARVGTLVIGGEQLTSRHLSSWRSTGARIINEYGPTEATVGCCNFTLSADEPESGVIPIGRPLADSRLFVVDARLRLVPIGSPGELLIGGSGLCRGYLHKPELTASSFIPDPFVQADDPDHAGQRLYRSGDKVRYLADGNLVFMNRLDGQVKLRGFRIELEEIESALARSPNVQQAVAAISGDRRQDHRLVCHVVLEKKPVSEDEQKKSLYAFLKKCLPAYMVPSELSFVSHIPLTPNGKVDHRALSALVAEKPELDASLIALTPLEEILAGIWREILEINIIQASDDFFEIGGNSLLSTQVVAGIQDQLDLDLSVGDVFENPVLSELAAVVEELLAEEGRELAVKSEYPVLVPIRKEGKEPPWFCVHPSGGQVHWFTDLANKGAHRFYGLQSPGVSGGPILTDRREIAERYLESIRRIQPRGPYSLAGWSLGGIIAMEMAAILVARGERAQHLVLIDSAPKTFAPDPDAQSELSKIIGFVTDIAFSPDFSVRGWREALDEIPATRRLTYAYSRLKQTGDLSPGLDPASFERLYRVHCANSEAAAQPIEFIYPGPVDLVRARHTVAYYRSFQHEGFDETFGWSGYCRQAPLIHTVEGNHFSIFDKDKAEHLAKVFEEIRIRADMN